MACCCIMDMGNTAVLAASVALKGWWRDWSDWQCNDRQSQSFCLSFKVIFRSKKPLILDVIVIGNFVIVNPVWLHNVPLPFRSLRTDDSRFCCLFAFAQMPFDVVYTRSSCTV